MTDTVLYLDVSTGRAMNDSIKNNRNLRKKRKRLFDMGTTDDYDGSRPLVFSKKKRNRSERMELELEMKRLRRKNTMIQVVIFSAAVLFTVGMFKYLFF